LFLIVALLFTLSGAAALSCEITWTRLLALVLGSTTHSISLILGTFMLGFCLGGVAGGRLADRSRRPLGVFALLQAFLGAYAFLFPRLLEGIEAAAGTGGVSDGIRTILAFVVLLPPTTAMGATFPLVARSVIATREGIASGSGFLFGCNLVGAALGAAASGFLAIRTIGLEGTIRSAAVVHLLVAATAAFVARGMERESRPALPSEPLDPRDPVASGVLFVYAAAGFSAIGLQVVWTRVLTFFLEGFTYTFTAIVCVYLGGMFAGSWVFGWLFRRRRVGPSVLPGLAAAASLSALGALAWLERYPEGPESLRFAFSPAPGTVGFAAGLLVAALVFLGLPTFFFGAMLPVSARLYVRAPGVVGTGLGWLYGLNNLGAGIGGLVAGYWILGALGTKGGMILYCGIGIVASIVALAASPASRGRAGLAFALGVSILFGVGAAAIRPARPLILDSHVFRGSRGPEHELVETREGSAGTVSVVDNLRTGERFLYTDDFLAAGTGHSYRYMRMLGHLPALFAERRGSALVIGFGSGTTAGALAAHPFETLRVVEISPDVYEVADHFRDVNAGVLEDPRVSKEVEDGRHLLASDAATYDVITLEPLMPYTPGAVSLYTREFYALGLARLREGGTFCQWVPVHAMRTPHFTMLLRTFGDVFPFASVWFYEQSALLLGSRQRPERTYREIRIRTEEAAVAADLAAAGYGSADAVLGGFVTAGEDLVEWLGEGAVMSDDLPIMEFFPLPRSTVTTFAADNLSSMRETIRFPGTILRLDTTEAEADRLRAWTRSTAELMSGMAARSLRDYLALTGRPDEASVQMFEALRSFAAALSIQPANRQAEWHLRDSRYLVLLGDAASALAAGEPLRARAAAERAVEIHPDRPEGHYYLGVSEWKRGNADAARGAFRDAVSRYPRHAGSLWHLALLAHEAGERAEAVRYLRRAREADPQGPLPAATREGLLRELSRSRS
jgi:spermidine synthase